ncbi:Hypothetical protein NCS54_01293200 [Fusarium falciforme]|uniref:Hypothetical protein n=1 Tax=Fusarium falciforme TaxID=195108 RepID=UPI002300FFDA|nr:Hypothetical protein NCS54_01293200 [Fusarium falciforme]WAO95319.1 Hypothetical protein NCS54_01293200 [Fusarium falciforme]
MPKQNIGGWRSGLAFATSVAGLVTLTNLVFLLVALPIIDMSSNGEGYLYTGSCKAAKQFSIWIHLAINILATLLLGAGNYTQQVLTGPTRPELDRAHARRIWLDVGVSSIRNLGKISFKRVAAWAVLAISSLPIHLLYNSVVYFETSANRYWVYPTMHSDLVNSSYAYGNKEFDALKTSLNEFEKLTNSECMTAYGQKLVSGRSDVILILDPSTVDTEFGYTVRWSGDPNRRGSEPYDWMCGRKPWADEQCDVSSLDVDNWPLYSDDKWVNKTSPRVEYCLSKRTPEYCKLALNIYLLAIVVGCNVVKLIGLGLTWLCLKQQPLLTLGDVMASFLQDPDPATKSRSLMSKSSGHRLYWGPELREWLPGKHRWAASVSVLRYGVTVVLCVGALSLTSYLLYLGVEHVSVYETPSLAALWNRGFGQLSVDALIDFSGIMSLEGPVVMVLIANLPQLILSLLYTALNGMWTAMLVGVEWNTYGQEHKGLRTSSPAGNQRRTYWLSLPLRYGLPLLAGSAALHWLISQSIFFVRLVIYKDGTKANVEATVSYDFRETTCGYSPIAIVFTIILGALILLITVGMSLRPMTTAIPVGGPCSAVISAACHAPEGDEDAALKLVRWGAVGGTNKLCVTSWPVKPPEVGRLY